MSAEVSTAMDERAAERSAFLERTDWASARIVPLGSDASIRQYFRLEDGPEPALLMDAPAAAMEPPCPPDADERRRRKLGYGAMVRGSANSLLAYKATAEVLAERGLLVPRMLADDLEHGFAIVSDLGAELVSDASTKPEREAELYRRAADALDKLREKEAKPGDVHGWPVQAYDYLAYGAEVALLDEWFLPYAYGKKLADEERTRLADAWGAVFAKLSPARHYVHRDFHADNLVVTEERIGVLDFQDLMVGQAAYDWVSLIEDARRDVTPGLREELYARAVSGADDPHAFETDYAILGAQRNAKILGLFMRLVHRDGKPRYESLIPRVRNFFLQDLARPPLAEVRGVLVDLCPELFQ
ncbi:phosphotransferase [Parvularcula sp. ZS-1/3]|uniref:Phosphotransferase n=1 Tax=Parvularcula mediterranea TaxID=2732508 RepID=A0A7Y3RL60_9PROT|nr:phosphotransferase [Parvularcula mediterranea]NNU16093.1 phosphotransferase [Parvularcula mediterranea]